jgi:hypothetical protein
LFRAKTRGEGTVKSLEIKAIGWFGIDEMPDEMNRSQKHFIKQVLEA